MRSTNPIPDDAFLEEAIGLVDVERPDSPESDPIYLLVQSGFGFHVKLGNDGDRGLRSEDEIADLVRRALYHQKALTLHIEF